METEKNAALEQAFAAYFEEHGFAGMHATLVDIMYSAFRAGWLAAGGDPAAGCGCSGGQTGA